MTTLDVGSWNLYNGLSDKAANQALATAWRKYPHLAVLATQEMHGRRLRGPDGISTYHPDRSNGEDDNALQWVTARFDLLDAYPLILSEHGWETVRGGRTPRRVAPVVLLRDVADGGEHAFASIHLPPSLERPYGVNRGAKARVSIAEEALGNFADHAHVLRREGFQVHALGDWNVHALRDTGKYAAWPERPLGDLLHSAWREQGRGDQPGTHGPRRLIDDLRTTSPVEWIHSLDKVGDHRLVIARIHTS